MNFNQKPAIKISGRACLTGWKPISEELLNKIEVKDSDKTIVTIECYQGVHKAELTEHLIELLNPVLLIQESDYLLSEDQILEITYPDVTDDRIFGKMTGLEIKDLLDSGKVNNCRQRIKEIESGIILILGTGAALVEKNPDLLVYADMARWEIQLRMRNNEVANIGVSNSLAGIEEKYKRGYFVDWRICDKQKKDLYDDISYFLDTNKPNKPKLIDKETFETAMQETVAQPFSLVPFFDPGPWGGQWMREVCNLDDEAENYAWCFNCVPEENSILYEFDNGEVVEFPSVNIVFFQPKALLGEGVYKRFGAEFPIRFDFLDTVKGGNLSLQVHPSEEYIKKEFGLGYTQDESYYMLDAEKNAKVYLGLNKGIDPDSMIEDLKHANNGGASFEAEKFAASWPAKKHDHFLIPNGTVHCSGEGCMVLEISATPYIFTFKLWDWGRLGLDGKPRPINVERGEEVIKWDRDNDWVLKNLINNIEKINEGDGWVEEKTGLHDSQFIETRRHWFSKPVTHKANGSVTVFNLVEGKEAVVSSPTGEFEPFTVHYAETFIIPAHIKEYVIAPSGESKGKKIATIKAFVRT